MRVILCHTIDSDKIIYQAHFRIYRCGASQRLGLSTSLASLADTSKFRDILAKYDVIASPVEPLSGGSYQELEIKPPLTTSQLATFGNAAIRLACDLGYKQADEILFWDHSTGQPQLIATS